MLLFLALMIVYIVWYQVKWSEVKKSIQSQNPWSGIQILNKSGDVMPTIDSILENTTPWFTGSTENISGNVKITTGMTIQGKTWSNIKISKTTTGTVNTTGTMSKDTTIKLLSGTSIYYWSIAVIEKLWIKYQYALADEKGIWYIYLGTPSYDFASIARALKGSLYTVATEQDLIQNQLFGNKVIFINLPEYKDKQVLMLIYLNDGIWLVQMDYKLYHKSKAYIKSLFID